MLRQPTLMTRPLLRATVVSALSFTITLEVYLAIVRLVIH